MAAGDALVLLDDFNRANGGIGANWGDLFSGTPGLSIISNRAGTASSGAISYWNVSTFGPDVEVAVDVPVVALFFWVHFRITNPGVNASLDGYEVGWQNGDFFVYRIDNGGFTTLDSQPGTISNGDKLMGRAVGDSIECWKYSGSAWSLVASATDATYSTAGYIGLESGDPGVRFDNYSGGTIAAASTSDRVDDPILRGVMRGVR